MTRDEAFEIAMQTMSHTLGLALGLRQAYAAELAGCGTATLDQMIGDLRRTLAQMRAAVAN